MNQRAMELILACVLSSPKVLDDSAKVVGVDLRPEAKLVRRVLRNLTVANEPLPKDVEDWIIRLVVILMYEMELRSQEIAVEILGERDV